MPHRIYFKNNPKLGLATIMLPDGSIEYRINCINTLHGWMLKDGVGGTPIDIFPTAKEVFDHELKVIVSNSSGLIQGIVAFKDDVPEFGYFTPNPFKNCTAVIKGVRNHCIDVAILPDSFKEHLAEGWYYYTKDWKPNQLVALNSKDVYVDNGDKTYSIAENVAKYKKAIEVFEKSSFPLDKDLQLIARMLGSISFGVELETANGTMPTWLLAKYGVVICKDGSTKGQNGKYPPEYVTVPLKGAKGLQVLRNLPPEIAKRSDINLRCSYHLHLGGITINRVLFVSLYCLCRKIQADVFKMLPAYKVNWEKTKTQNYCKYLPDIISNFGTKNFNEYINETYNDIYCFLGGGQESNKLFNKANKANPWKGGDKKWNVITRYHWINLTNILFSDSETIEFRPHSPTLNPDKIINWLLMCVAIVRYAETYVKACISDQLITFEQVLDFYKDSYGTNHAAKLSDNLIEYYHNRVAYFAKDLNNKDYLSEKELIDDREFVFNTTKLYENN